MTTTKPVTNPLDLTIGDKVLILAVSDVDYDEHGNRIVFKDDLPEPKEMMVVGVKRKGLGQYLKGSPGGYSGVDDLNDPMAPELKVSKYVWFYECREKLTSKTVLVDAKDISTTRPPVAVKLFKNGSLFWHDTVMWNRQHEAYAVLLTD